jgi:hypothetical protein
MGILLISKLAFACFLVFIFFLLFGAPSIQKFLARQTLVVKSSKQFEETDNPALTVCPGQGWKGREVNPAKSGMGFKIMCGSSADAEEALRCINIKSFNLSDMVISAVDGGNQTLEADHWMENLSWISNGKCQTLNVSQVKIGSDLFHPLIIIFNTTVDTYTMIHDPNFFILGPNPQTMPRIMTIQNEDYDSKLLYIQTIEHVKMNLPEKPCEDSPTYTLTGCISSSISHKVGCRPQWDRMHNKTEPICTEMEQLVKIDKEYNDLAIVEQTEIRDQTGCLLPCRYKEYKVADEPLTVSMETRSINLIRATKTVLIETEVLVYPFSSFLAEFGGALGLFVGFLFLMLWDVLQLVLNILYVKKKQNLSKKF